MASIMSTIKENPAIVAGGAGVLLLIFMTSRGGGASGNAGVTLQSQQIATEGAINLAAIRANENAAMASSNRDIYVSHIGAQRDLSLGGMRAATEQLVSVLALRDATQSRQTARDISFNQNMTDKAIALGQLQNNIDLANISADITREGFAFQSGESAKGFAFAQGNLPILSDLQVRLAQVDADTAVELSRVQYATDIANLNAARDIANINIQPQLIGAKSSRQSNTVNDILKIGKTIGGFL